MPLIVDKRNFLSEYTSLKIWHTTESEATLSAMFPMAAVDSSQRLADITSSQRRLEILVSHILFQLTFPPEAELLHRNSGGPLAWGTPMCMSISHTKGYVALISSPYPVGIDIEMWSPRALKIAHKFLKPQEMRLMDTDEERERDAVRLWTAKEAVYKCWSENITLHEDILLAPGTKSPLEATCPPIPWIPATSIYLPCVSDEISEKMSLAVALLDQEELEEPEKYARYS